MHQGKAVPFNLSVIQNAAHKLQHTTYRYEAGYDQSLCVRKYCGLVEKSNSFI